MPVVKQQVVIVGLLAFLPAIEGFVHDEKTHPVAEIEQFRCRWIVRSTDGVATHLLEQGKLPPQGRLVDRRADGPEIVVITHTLDRHPLAVEQKTVLGGELDRPHPERVFVAIYRLAVLETVVTAT